MANVVAAASVAAAAACELAEVVVPEPPELTVVEAHLRVRLPAAGATAPAAEAARAAQAQAGAAEVTEAATASGAEPESDVFVLLHRSGGASGPRLAGSSATLRAGGESFPLAPADTPQPCVVVVTSGGRESVDGDAACLHAELPHHAVAPGAEAELEVFLPDGTTIRGTTTVPGAFRVLRPAAAECRLSPDRSLELVWTRSDGAWGYASEATLDNLQAAFAPLDVRPPVDRLVLQALAISASDTTTTFPRHFGIFDRLGSFAPFLAHLRDGLPAGVHARIIVTAVDRNHVNWIRGGGFHPSGRVRIPSVAEAGETAGPPRATGVFGSTVRISFELRVAAPAPPAPSEENAGFDESWYDESCG